MSHAIWVAGTMLLAVLVTGCGGTATARYPSASDSIPSADMGFERMQTSDGGQVTVEVEWSGPSAGAQFHVTMDTHAVDLDPLDLTDATLRNDRGATMTALAWAAPKGGHHRQGYLSFDGDATAFFADARWIELVLEGVGDVPERVLRWEVAT